MATKAPTLRETQPAKNSGFRATRRLREKSSSFGRGVSCFFFLKFQRVTIRGAQPSARLSEEICLSEGSAGVAQRALRGSLRGFAGLCGVPRDFLRFFGGGDAMLVTLANCWTFFKENREVEGTSGKESCQYETFGRPKDHRDVSPASINWCTQVRVHRAIVFQSRSCYV